MRASTSILLGSLLTSANAQNYTERYRPQYHWTPAKNWMNDPNGLIYHNGQYHMYYQYNPNGDVWGNISWGHAISSDLMHWKEQPIALNAFTTPPGGSLSEFFFSGSSVYDQNNTSGFGIGTHGPLVAAYTSYYPNNITLPNGQIIPGGTQAQSISYSNDEGMTWKEFTGNPVLPVPPSPYENQWKDFRDPNIFWYAAGGHWVMVASLAQLQKLVIYNSPDLKKWTLVSEFGPINAMGGVWECPNLFPLPLDGDESNIKWVLLTGINPGNPQSRDSSATQYIVGSFNGTTFEADAASIYRQSSGQANWLDYGPDYYAASTYNGLANYERVAITWMSDWAYAGTIPTSPWRSAMAIPRKLTLETIGGQSRLISTPVQTLQGLETKTLLYSKQWNSTSSGTVALPVTGKALDISVTFSAGSSSQQVGLGVRAAGRANATLIGYDFASQQMFLNRNAASDNSTFSPSYQGGYYAPLQPANGVIKMRIFLDWSSVEVFGGRGESTITAQIFPLDANTGVLLFSNGDAKDVTVNIEEVPSVWKSTT